MTDDQARRWVECRTKVHSIHDAEELRAFRLGWIERFGSLTTEEYKVLREREDRLRR